MSGKRFAGVLCILCGERESSRAGEHVWPMWLLSIFPVGEGPYRAETGAGPVLTRAGAVREYSAIPTVQMPCCETCNDALNKRFEQRTTKEVVLAAIDGQGVVEAAAAERFGIWWLKTMLLLSHPSSLDSSVGTSPPRWNLTQVPDDLYSWTVTGQAPPEGLTVWLSRRSVQPVQESRERPAMSLPTVVADGRTVEFMVRRVAVKSLEATLLYHPGWPVEHPLEAEVEVIRIWPAPTGGFDLGALRRIAPWPTKWVPGPTLKFVDGAYGSEALPSLDNVGFGQSVPGVEAAWF